MTAGRLVTENWGLKLLALLLAWGIWFVLRGDLEERQDATVRVTLDLPPGIDGEPLPASVAVRLHGHRRDLDAFLRGVPSMRVRVETADLAVDQTSATRVVEPRELVPLEPFGAHAVRVAEFADRAGLRLRLWRVEARTIQLAQPLFPGIEDLPVRVERPSWPTQATVEGPVEELARILALRTTVDRDQLRQFAASAGDAPRTSVTLPLTIADVPSDRLRVLSPVPAKFAVTADLVRAASRTIEVPLLVLAEGGPARPLRLEAPGRAWFLAGDPPRISLELRGSPRALESIVPEQVRAFVLASELAPGADAGDLRVHVADLPAGVAPALEDLRVSVRTQR